MDLDLVRHALAAARRHGYAEVELGEGEASFTARLARNPKGKAAPAAEAPQEQAPKEVRSTLVGYYREAKEPLAVGLKVKKGQAVATVEALGIATDVLSKVEGEVVEVLVSRGRRSSTGRPWRG